MVTNSDMGMKRQLSRRVSIVSGKRPFRFVWRLAGIVTVAAVGFLCGHLVYHVFLTPDHVVTDSEEFVNHIHGKRGFPEDRKHADKSLKGMQVTEADSSKRKVPQAEKNIHMPPKERDGSEIKKDMSVQFRDYVPKKVFLNCGGTYPVTLDLFLHTYPNAQKYDVYTFLPDESYALFYQTYKRHTLYTPVIVSTQKTSIESTNNGFASMVEQRDTIDTLDLPSWILANLHQDDYVILKLDSQFETDIVKSLSSKDAIEWVDKFYTTSNENKTLAVYRKNLGKFNKDVYIWNNSAQTYSDFDAMNPPGIPHGMGAVMSQCVDPTESEKFGLFLFAEQFTSHVNQTLNKLIMYAGERKVGVTIFLPLESYRSISRLTMRGLAETFTIGLFIGVNNVRTNQTEDNSEFNRYRNMYVESASLVKKHTESILQHVMVPSAIVPNIYRNLSKTQQVTVINQTKSISHHSQTLLQSGVLTMDMIGRAPGEILAVDLMGDYADVVTLYMTKRFEPWLIPVSKCQTSTNTD